MKLLNIQTPLVILACLFLLSCSNDNIQDLSAKPAPNNPTWYNSTQKILQNNCAICHIHEGFNSLENVRYQAEAIQAEIKSGAMPPLGPLSKSDEQAVFAWFKAGTPIGEAVVIDSLLLSPMDKIRTVIEQKCLVCHNSGGQQPYLNTDQLIQNNSQAILTQVHAGTMPQNSTLTSEQRQILEYLK